MTDTIVIYHGGCRDGFCAAWVVDKYLNQKQFAEQTKEGLTYHPGYYGQEPPDVKGKNIIVVDFSYDLETMKHISKDAKGFLWLDHHKTALGIHEYFEKESYQYGTTLDWRFDNGRSGAGLAWDYFFPNEPRPWLVDYVEDRDLWVKKLDDTDEINAYIACLEFDFKVWDDTAELDVEDVAEYGKTAIMKTEQYVREACKNAYYVDLYSRAAEKLVFHLPVVNICQVDCSEVLHELAKTNQGISMYWFKRADGMYQYGLRSIGDIDVSEIAKLFGGGGHKNAAGFQLNYLLGELK